MVCEHELRGMLVISKTDPHPADPNANMNPNCEPGQDMDQKRLTEQVQSVAEFDRGLLRRYSTKIISGR